MIRSCCLWCVRWWRIRSISSRGRHSAGGFGSGGSANGPGFANCGLGRIADGRIVGGDCLRVRRVDRRSREATGRFGPGFGGLSARGVGYGTHLRVVAARDDNGVLLLPVCPLLGTSAVPGFGDRSSLPATETEVDPASQNPSGILHLRCEREVQLAAGTELNEAAVAGISAAGRGTLPAVGRGVLSSHGGAVGDARRRNCDRHRDTHRRKPAGCDLDDPPRCPRPPAGS